MARTKKRKSSNGSGKKKLSPIKEGQQSTFGPIQPRSPPANKKKEEKSKKTSKAPSQQSTRTKKDAKNKLTGSSKNKAKAASKPNAARKEFGKKKKQAKKGKSKDHIPHKASSQHVYKKKKTSTHVSPHHPPNLRRGNANLHPKQMRFKLTLPRPSAPAPLYNEMPWYRATQYDDENVVDYSNSSLVECLPAFLTEEKLQRLDQELWAFSSYVRLTQQEFQARDFLQQHIQDTCVQVFAGKQVTVQAFGSFATLEVCSFLSDVDLVIEGVVPTATHTIFTEKKRKASEDSTAPSTKQARLQKWKDALAELDAAERQDDEIQAAAITSLNGKESENAKVTCTDQVATASDAGSKESKYNVDCGCQATKECAESSVNESKVPDVQQGEQQDGQVARAGSSTTKETAHAQGDILVGNDEVKSVTANERVDAPFLFVVDRVGGTAGLGLEKTEDVVVADQNGTASAPIVDVSKSEPANQGVDVPPQDFLFVVDRNGDAVVADQNGTAGAPIVLDKSPEVANESAKVLGDGTAEAPFVVGDGHAGESLTEAATAKSVDGDDDAESDNDSADKLEAYREKPINNDKDGGRTVSLSSTSEDNESEADSLEVSFVSNPSEATLAQKVGPTGTARRLVLNALHSLGRALRKSPVTHTLEVRRHARVPIVSTATYLGFEGDVGVAGHNGTDTSQYASCQSQRFKSFAPVVLLLKILLNQQQLDKPFVGGLGSYKLYVLVAHHIEQHIALGGADRPSEVLLTFFHRYRQFCDGKPARSDGLETVLAQDSVIKCNGASAEMNPVFKLRFCCQLFDGSWSRLLKGLGSGNEQQQVSYLGRIVNVAQLANLRNICRNKASQLDHYRQSTTTSSKRSGRVFKKPPPAVADANARELMAGYGVAHLGEKRCLEEQGGKSKKKKAKQNASNRR